MPVYVLIVTSFKGLARDRPVARVEPAEQVDVRRLARRLRPALARTLANSFKLVIPATLISVVLGSLNGFVLLEVALPRLGRRLHVPPVRDVHPLPGGDDPAHTAVSVDVGFPTGIPRLIFAHVVYGIPITTLIFRNYYATIPDELIEAARIDGAGMLRTYWSVVLPLLRAGVRRRAIWQFTSIWNDFLFAVFLITNPADWPVTVALNNTTGSLVTPFNLQMSAALLASLPTLIVYILLGRYFMRGLMAGALKG